jgi:elongation factor G
MAAVRVADAALVVVSAEKGVEVGTELLWRHANRQELPRMVFVNKLDRENTSYDRALESLRSHFGTRIVPLTIPIGEQANFSGVIDLVANKAYSFSGDTATAADVPGEMADAVQRYREQLVETAVESDDDLMAKYLEGEEVTEEELRRAIKAGVASGQVVPVLAGSAAKNIGIQTLLDAMTEYLPSAADRAPSDAAATPVAFVFKTIVDPQKGTHSIFRVYQGTIKPDSHLFNVNTSTDERLGQILCLRGKLQETMTEVSVGDIATVVRLNKTHTGDTLGAKDTQPLPPINFPQPVYTAAVHPKTQSDLDKLGTALNRMLEEDRTLHVDRDQETAEMLLSGMGESHLEIATERMQRRYGVEVLKRDRRVPYREAIRKKARAEGRHKKQTGGHGQFGDVIVEIKPLKRGEGFHFSQRITGGVVPRQWIPAVEQGVRDGLQRGPLGFPVTDVSVTLIDGSYHAVDSSEMAFRQAGRLAMDEGLRKCNPHLLEPIEKLTIHVPNNCTSGVTSMLSGKRGQVLGFGPRDGWRGWDTVEAYLPRAERGALIGELRSLSQGLGVFEFGFDHMTEVTGRTADDIVHAHGAKREPA